MFRYMSNFRDATALLAVLGTVAFVPAVFAADDNESGPYLGGGYGQFDTSVDDVEELGEAIDELDTDDSAWKVFFGWRFNKFISLELDYIDLGSPRGDFGGSGDSGQYQLDLAGIGGYAIGTLPIGIFELSAKVGYYFHDLEINVDLDNFGSGNGDVLDSDESGEALVYGVGAGVTLFEQLNAKIEYELFDVDRLDDSYAFWLTAAWRF
jgi:Outer membrane protein beta-barrel domain